MLWKIPTIGFIAGSIVALELKYIRPVIRTSGVQKGIGVGIWNDLIGIPGSYM